MNIMNLEYKTCLITEKAEKEDGSLHIKFYACCFGNIDSWGDIILPGACDAFLASEDEKRMKLCYQHDRASVIGVITSKTADDHGLLVEADILPTTLGKDVIMLIKSGALNEFSIGFYADKYHFERRDGMDDNVRILEAITIREVSIVTFAANPEAVLISAKNEEQKDDKPDMASIISGASDEELESMAAQIEEEKLNRLIVNL